MFFQPVNNEKISVALKDKLNVEVETTAKSNKR